MNLEDIARTFPKGQCGNWPVILPHRTDLAMHFKGVGVEIGVQAGAYSELILLNDNVTKLYSVDPWSADCPMYRDQLQADEHYAYTLDRLGKFGLRSSIYRGTGQNFGHAMAGKRFDFVYIDSSHEYEETCEQCWIWWSLLKDDGYLCGHDFVNGEAVRRAVEFFCYSTLKQPIYLTHNDDDVGVDFPVNSWMIFKGIKR